MKWKIEVNEQDLEIHVLPIECNDEDDHEIDSPCFCRPNAETIGAWKLIVHIHLNEARKTYLKNIKYTEQGIDSVDGGRSESSHRGARLFSMIAGPGPGCRSSRINRK